MTRTPLMAGNWKMNLDHLEAISLVQKLALTLKDLKHDYATTEAAVIVPFTDIRSVQTLVESEEFEIGYGAQDVSIHDKGAFTRKVCKNGCIGCKKCEKTCENGAITVTDNLASIDPRKCTSCGACVTACPTGAIVTCASRCEAIVGE